MKTLLAILLISSVLSLVLGGGEFAILHSPSGISFKGNEAIRSDELPKILSTAMGHATEMEDSWNGLSITNPFNYPYVGIVVSIEGIPSLQLADQSYPLQMNTSPEQIKEDYLVTMGDLLYDENDLNSGENRDITSFEKLDSNSEAALAIANDLGIIQDLKQKALLKMPMQNVWIQLNGLKTVSLVYGQDSEEMSEASNLIKSALNDLVSTLDVVLNKRYVLSVITNDQQDLLRKRREAPRAGKGKDPNCTGLNLSKQYGSDYAAIFNIILWTSVFLIAAIISTAVFICTMDPGRDSIIYRMTTQRMKKDN